MIVIAKTKIQIKKFSNICIRYHLYQNESWEMFNTYHEPYKIVALGIFLQNSIPVSACMLINGRYNIGTYTNIEYRRKGIGASLVRAMYDEFPGHPRKWAKGIIGSENFYKKTLEFQYSE
jgi:predicted GNAT family acetyltransferase